MRDHRAGSHRPIRPQAIGGDPLGRLHEFSGKSRHAHRAQTGQCYSACSPGHLRSASVCSTHKWVGWVAFPASTFLRLIPRISHCRALARILHQCHCAVFFEYSCDLPMLCYPTPLATSSLLSFDSGPRFRPHILHFVLVVTFRPLPVQRFDLDGWSE